MCDSKSTIRSRCRLWCSKGRSRCRPCLRRRIGGARRLAFSDTSPRNAGRLTQSCETPARRRPSTGCSRTRTANKHRHPPAGGDAALRKRGFGRTGQHRVHQRRLGLLEDQRGHGAVSKPDLDGNAGWSKHLPQYLAPAKITPHYSLRSGEVVHVPHGVIHRNDERGEGRVDPAWRAPVGQPHAGGRRRPGICSRPAPEPMLRAPQSRPCAP